jgi:hypothetical protein
VETVAAVIAAPPTVMAPRRVKLFEWFLVSCIVDPPRWAPFTMDPFGQLQQGQVSAADQTRTYAAVESTVADRGRSATVAISGAMIAMAMDA